MTIFEVDYAPKAGKWGVYDRDIPLTAEGTKQAAFNFAKTEATPGDTIVKYARDGWKEEEYLVGDDGSLTAAGSGGNGGGGLPGMGGGNGGDGLFGGDDWF